jgi:hypothetical protein
MTLLWRQMSWCNLKSLLGVKRRYRDYWRKRWSLINLRRVSRSIRTSKKCSFDGCINKATSGAVCKAHGAKIYVYIWSVKGCTNNVQGGFCITHGAKRYVYICSHKGCNKTLLLREEFVSHMVPSLQLQRCSLEKYQFKQQPDASAKRFHFYHSISSSMFLLCTTVSTTGYVVHNST